MWWRVSGAGSNNGDATGGGREGNGDGGEVGGGNLVRKRTAKESETTKGQPGGECRKSQDPGGRGKQGSNNGAATQL